MVSGRKTTLALANIVLGTVLGLAANRIIALYWGPSYAGQVTAAGAFIGLAFFVTDLGMGQAHIKRVSEGRHPGDCFVTFAVFKLVATGAFVAIVLGGLWTYVIVLGRTIEDTTMPVIGIMLAFQVFKSLQEIGQSSFEARIETAKLQAATFSDTAARVGVTLALGAVVAALLHDSGPLAGRLDPTNPIVAWVQSDPAAALALAQLAGGLAAAIVAIILLKRIGERGRFDWALLKDYWSFALPLFFTSAVAAIVGNVDAAMIGLFMSDVDAGIWGRVKAVVQVLAGVSPVVGGILFPAISGLAARGEHTLIGDKMDRAVRYLSMLMAPAVLFTAFFAASVIHLTLSDAFLSGALTMSVLAVSVYFMSIGAPHANLIMGMGQPRIVARVGVTTMVLVIVLNLLLIPRDIRSLGIRLADLGILGAAISSLVSAISYYAMCRYYSWRVSGYRERAATWKHILAAGIMTVGLVAMQRYAVGLEHWYQLPLYMATGAALYLVALLALREFGQEDVAFVQESLHPGEMIRYVRAEIFHRKK